MVTWLKCEGNILLDLDEVYKLGVVHYDPTENHKKKKYCVYCCEGADKPQVLISVHETEAEAVKKMYTIAKSLSEDFI